MTLDELYKIIEDRKDKMPKDSYTASVLKSGDDRIIQKVGEEATEVLIAAKNKNRKEIISEVSDLVFHLLILLVNSNIKLSEILDELESRKK